MRCSCPRKGGFGISQEKAVSVAHNQTGGGEVRYRFQDTARDCSSRDPSSMMAIVTLRDVSFTDMTRREDGEAKP